MTGTFQRLWRSFRRSRFKGLQQRVEALESRVLELQERVLGESESKTRWMSSTPDQDLTWGHYLTGDSFVAELERLGAFGDGKAILEIGPGYGRLIEAILRRGCGFSIYQGVDLSPKNIEFLKSRFTDPRIEFIVGDAEKVRFDRRFDTVISSLTFKHLFPTFEPTLRHLHEATRPGTIIVFDLMERSNSGSVSSMDYDPEARAEGTFVRRYTPDEVRGIVLGSGFELEELGHVTHERFYTRMLVACREPGSR